MSLVPEIDDGYFNDLSRQPSLPNSSTQNTQTNNAQGSRLDECELPKPKRVACAICRKRKLKCDGGRPKCGTCARLGHNCAYDEIRRKSGPKRGYVKELEARLGIFTNRDRFIVSAVLTLCPIPSTGRDPTQNKDPRTNAQHVRSISRSIQLYSTLRQCVSRHLWAR